LHQKPVERTLLAGGEGKSLAFGQARGQAVDRLVPRQGVLDDDAGALHTSTGGLGQLHRLISLRDRDQFS
jgi:hypothetical protein